MDSKKILKINELNVNTGRTWSICAKVVKKSDIIPYINGKFNTNGQRFVIDVSDSTGIIRIVAFDDIVNKFYSKIEINGSYIISGGRIQMSNKDFNKLDHDCEIILKTTTTIEKAKIEPSREEGPLPTDTADRTMSDGWKSMPGHYSDIVNTNSTPEKCEGDPGSFRSATKPKRASTAKIDCESRKIPSPNKRNLIDAVGPRYAAYSTNGSNTEMNSSNSNSVDDFFVYRCGQLSIRDTDSPSGSTQTLHSSINNQKVANHNENSPNSTRDEASRSRNVATTDNSCINFNTAPIDSFVFIDKTLTRAECDAWQKNITSWKVYEQDELSHRGGYSYVYLFLDPRVTNDLPNRTDQLDRVQIWNTFLESIFYIGKGFANKEKGGQYNDYRHHLKHLETASTEYSNAEPRPDVDEKTRKIIEIWNENKGVVCVQVFHNSCKNDTDVRVETMNRAIRLKRPADRLLGEDSFADGSIITQRIKLGVHLLHRAMYVYLHDGERQLKKTENINTKLVNRKSEGGRAFN